MMHDWTTPTLCEERIEDEAERIIEQQRKAEDAWQKFVARTIEDARRILADMPLGCPVPGYDAASIDSLMWDWMQVAPDPDEQWKATDMAREKINAE